MLLEHLWYGNIHPQEQCTANNAELRHILKRIEQNRKRLCETLTPEQKEAFEAFDDCVTEMYSIVERETFAYGFRLGGKLVSETLQMNLPLET